MIITVIKSRWNEFWQNVLPLRRKRHNNPSIKVNSARERSMSIFQRRYGYTREKAIFELDKHDPRLARLKRSISRRME